ncbi:hypothetical protein R1flu_023351 [Riccia fluitans]|uniref:Uncharacterized protein n=1 Tax=Riccia fluitans TaxID=41844 RepID=A0ABD1XRT0_9MARC
MWRLHTWYVARKIAQHGVSPLSGRSDASRSRCLREQSACGYVGRVSGRSLRCGWPYDGFRPHGGGTHDSRTGPSSRLAVYASAGPRLAVYALAGPRGSRTRRQRKARYLVGR